MRENDNPPKLNFIEKGLIWLSTADSEVLRKHCPKWERLKYAAFGASLLVPFLFGMIAASYAVSTLTDNWFIIGGFAVVWGFIIITIDRVLLATYRAFIPFTRKVMQFVLRITVAVLMGLTVSHPLTLMLFRDTINSEIERARIEEMAAARGATDEQKKDVNDRIAKATENLQGLQQRYQEVIGGGFLNAANPEPEVAKTVKRTNQFSDIDAQIDNYKNDRDEVQRDLNRWQKVYDDEISGTRTGKPGIGPNARAIERDEIVWRREEVRRVGKLISDLTAKRTEMSSRLLAESARDNAEIERSRRELEQQKISMFKSQQGDLLAVIKGQIDSASAELSRLRTESEQITDNTIDRVDNLKEEKRADLMVQTLVLHHLFEKEGGGFALAVYVVIASLFTLIDTIPLVVKFFAVPGIYDQYQECRELVSEEVNFKIARKDAVREIKERAMGDLLNHDDSANSLAEIDELAKRKLDLVESLQQYEPRPVFNQEDIDDSIPEPIRPANGEEIAAAGSNGNGSHSNNGGGTNGYPLKKGKNGDAVDQSVENGLNGKQNGSNGSSHELAEKVEEATDAIPEPRRRRVLPPVTQQLDIVEEKRFNPEAKPQPVPETQPVVELPQPVEEPQLVQLNVTAPKDVSETIKTVDAQSPIQGNIEIPGLPAVSAQPAEPKAPTPIEGTIDFNKVLLTQGQAAQTPRPKNDFVEDPSNPEGFGSMIMTQNNGSDPAGNVPKPTPINRQSAGPGGVSIKPQDEANL